MYELTLKPTEREISLDELTKRIQSKVCALKTSTQMIDGDSTTLLRETLRQIERKSEYEASQPYKNCLNNVEEEITDAIAEKRLTITLIDDVNIVPLSSLARVHISKFILIGQEAEAGRSQSHFMKALGLIKSEQEANTDTTKIEFDSPVKQIKTAESEFDLLPITPQAGLAKAEQSTTHKIRNRTPPILEAEICQAKKQALNPDDPTSVWTELVKMTENKVGCLLEMDGKDIKYQSGDDVLFFKKRSLIERMNRAAPC
jgi:hypothetical protein